MELPEDITNCDMLIIPSRFQVLSYLFITIIILMSRQCQAKKGSPQGAPLRKINRDCHALRLAETRSGLAMTIVGRQTKREPAERLPYENIFQTENAAFPRPQCLGI